MRTSVADFVGPKYLGPQGVEADRKGPILSRPQCCDPALFRGDVTRAPSLVAAAKCKEFVESCSGAIQIGRSGNAPVQTRIEAAGLASRRDEGRVDGSTKQAQTRVEGCQVVAIIEIVAAR